MSPMAFANTSLPAWGARGERLAMQWTERFAKYRATYPELAGRDRTDATPGTSSRDGIATFLSSLQIQRAFAGRDASGEVLNVLAENIPWFLGGSADLGSSEQDDAQVQGCGRFSSRQPGREKSALWHPRACNGGHCERPIAVQTSRFRRHISYLQRLCPARDSTGCSDGAARPSMYSLTMRWETERTVRRISLWSSLHRCAPYQDS